MLFDYCTALTIFPIPESRFETFERLFIFFNDEDVTKDHQSTAIPFGCHRAVSVKTFFTLDSILIDALIIIVPIDGPSLRSSTQ